MYADLFLRPTVVKSCAADSDFFSGERDGDCHRHIVIRVQSFRVVNDVCVLELDFLHLGVLLRFLIDNLTFYGFESTVQLYDLSVYRQAILPVRFPFRISRSMIGYRTLA